MVRSVAKNLAIRKLLPVKSCPSHFFSFKLGKLNTETRINRTNFG